MALLKGIGRSITRAGSSGKTLGAVAAVAGTAGLISQTARPALEVGNEAIGDPNADRAFLGSRGLTPSAIIDAQMGPGVGATGTIAGGALGALGGGIIGAGVGSMLKNAEIAETLKVPSKVPVIGDKTILKAGKMGKIRGGFAVAGLGAVGAIAGATFGATQMARNYVERNRDFFEANPYSRGSAMQASATGAYGDIVLGMHNSRRG